MDQHTPTAPQAHEDPCPRCGQPVGDAWLVCAWCGAQLAAPAELPVGATLADGRYEVLGVIGRGGFGITYEMGDTRLKRRVAVKELFPESAVRAGSMVLTPAHARAAFRSSKERFLREARVLARFTHPGIVRVYEVFEEHGTAYLVMELLGGRTLVDIMRARNQPFTEAEVLDVAGRVAAALRPVHAADVLHRDINPSNVMLTEHGRIVVIDFGLARDFDQSQTMGMTRMVTPGYAPLEQYRGEARFGPSTDIYGLAATCYRLATGKVPVAAVERDAGADLPAPIRINPQISKPVSDAILDGLELEPAHRPQDLDAFLARLQIRLPESPRSLLLGSPGAEPSDLKVVGAHAGAAARLDDPGPATSRPSAPPPVDDRAPADAPPVEPQPVADSRTEVQAGTEVQSPVEVSEPGDAPAPPNSQLVTEAIGQPPAARASGATIADPAPHIAPDRTDDRTHVPPDPAATAWSVDSQGPGAIAGEPDPPSVGAVGALPATAGRAKVTVPLALLAVAAGSAAPLVVMGLVVLVALPALATLGDAVAQRHRAALGFSGGTAERRLPGAVLGPLRFVRNVGVSVVRCSPIIGVSAVLLAAWYALSHTALSTNVLDLLLRAVGGGAVAAVLLTSRSGSSRFRCGLGLDELAQRWAPEGRITERLVVAWIVVVIVIAAALWLSPAAFPLP